MIEMLVCLRGWEQHVAWFGMIGAVSFAAGLVIGALDERRQR